VNRDVLLDRAFLLGIRALTHRRRYFRDGVASSPFDVHLAEVCVEWPALDGVATTAVRAETLAGPLRAALSVRKWVGADAPTLVWHHGGGEYPYDTLFEGAFPDPAAVEANLVVVRAPGHETRSGVLDVGATLDRYLATMAVAVDATEHVVAATTGRSVVAGYSLGGFVTNRHHVAHDSADAYVPFMAGTAHGVVFLTTVPAAPRALAAPALVRERLDFTDEWRARDHDHVHAVLGLHDCLNRYETQRASYPGLDPEVWCLGHVRGGGAHARRRRVLDDHLSG